MDKVIVIECGELKKVNNDIYNTIQILYHNIFPKINKDILNAYEYDIIDYLIQNDINSKTFHLTNKQRFINDLSTEAQNERDIKILTQVYNETIIYLAEIKKNQIINTKKREYFMNEIRIEFDEELNDNNIECDELLANIITYFTNNQV